MEVSLFPFLSRRIWSRSPFIAADSRIWLSVLDNKNAISHARELRGVFGRVRKYRTREPRCTIMVPVISSGSYA